MTTTTTDTETGTGTGTTPGAVIGVDVCSLTDDGLTAALLEWETAAARQAVLMAVLVREVVDRDLGRRSGAASTMSWLRDRLRLRPGEAKTRIDLARRLTAGDPEDKPRCRLGGVGVGSGGAWGDARHRRRVGCRCGVR